MIKIPDWMPAIVVDDDGIVRFHDRRAALGAVLLILSEIDEIVVVTKAPKPGYEFSELDSLPGGLLRSDIRGPVHTEGISRIVIESLSTRVRAETGYQMGHVSNVNLQPPPITSYFDRGKQNYVVVLPFMTRATRGFQPIASDSSVRNARWLAPSTVVPNLSPANSLIVCSRFWAQFSPESRAVCASPVSRAVENCRQWATRIGCPPVDVSWFA